MESWSIGASLLAISPGVFSSSVSTTSIIGIYTYSVDAALSQTIVSD